MSPPLSQAPLANLTRAVAGAATCIIVAATPSAARADDPTSAPELAAAVEAAQSGAARSASQWFNAGLGFAHRLDTGNAVLAMERAQLLRPLDREIFDTRQRIQTAARTAHAERTGSQRFHVGEPPSIGWWRAFRSFPIGWAQMLLIAGAWIAAGAAFHGMWKPVLSPSQRLSRWIVGLLGGACAVVGGTLMLGHDVWTAGVHPHVVISSSPACRDAPDELARTRRHPDMYSGAVVRALEFRDPWIRVELAGGDQVWVDASDVAPIEQ